MHKKYRAPREPHRARTILFCILSATCNEPHAIFLQCDCGPVSPSISCHISNISPSISYITGRLPLVTPSQPGYDAECRKRLTKDRPASPFQFKLNFENVPTSQSHATQKGFTMDDFISSSASLFLSGSALQVLSEKEHIPGAQNRTASDQREGQ